MPAIWPIGIIDGVRSEGCKNQKFDREILMGFENNILKENAVLSVGAKGGGFP